VTHAKFHQPQPSGLGMQVG